MKVLIASTVVLVLLLLMVISALYFKTEEHQIPFPPEMRIPPFSRLREEEEWDQHRDEQSFENPRELKPARRIHNMYSFKKSRRIGSGDPIRGDLKITPISDGWFTPSVSQSDFNRGIIGRI